MNGGNNTDAQKKMNTECEGEILTSELNSRELQSNDIRQLLMWLDQMQDMAACADHLEKYNISVKLEDLLRFLILKPRRITVKENFEKLSKKINEWKYEYQKKNSSIELQSPIKNYSILFRTISKIPYSGDTDSPSLGHPTRKYEKLVEQYLLRPQDEIVSIIMPVYNASRSVERAISSVLKQLYKNFELIIIDDGSTDSTRKILRQYDKNLKLVCHFCDHSGVARARNLGLSLAKGKYIAYLDSDNEWYPEHLLLMVNQLRDFPEINLAYCAEEIYNNEIFEKIRFRLFNRSFLENTNYIDINSVVHKRKLYERRGGFDVALKRLEDWDLMLRYTEDNFPLCINCALVKYYRSDHSKNPVKNLKYRNARKYYRISQKVIQSKIQKKRMSLTELNSMAKKGLQLYANLHRVKVDESDSIIYIVIIGCENLKQIKVSIEAVLKYTPIGKYKLFVVDRSNSYDISKFFRTIESKSPGCKILRNHKDFIHFAENLKLYDSDTADSRKDLIIMHSGAIVTEGWIDALIQAKKDNIDANLIVPRQVLPAWSKDMRKHVPYCNIENEVDVALSVNKMNLSCVYPLDWGKGYMALDFVDPFFCLIPEPYLRKIIAGNFTDLVPTAFKSILQLAEKKDNELKIIYTPHAKVYRVYQDWFEEIGNSRFRLKLKSILLTLLPIWKKILTKILYL